MLGGTFDALSIVNYQNALLQFHPQFLFYPSLHYFADFSVVSLCPATELEFANGFVFH